MNDKIKTYQQGNILILTLIIISLLSMLIFNTVEASLLQIKLSHHIEQKMRLFQLAENNLKQIENSIQQQSCILKQPLLGQKLSYLDDKWWRSINSCQEHENDVSITYFIESLTIIPCYKIDGNEKSGVIFYRTTIRTTINSYTNQQVLLQSIYAMEAKNVHVCDGKIKTISAGRQAWSFLENPE